MFTSLLITNIYNKLVHDFVLSIKELEDKSNKPNKEVWNIENEQYKQNLLSSLFSYDKDNYNDNYIKYKKYLIVQCKITDKSDYFKEIEKQIINICNIQTFNSYIEGLFEDLERLNIRLIEDNKFYHRKKDNYIKIKEKTEYYIKKVKIDYNTNITDLLFLFEEINDFYTSYVEEKEDYEDIHYSIKVIKESLNLIDDLLNPEFINILTNKRKKI